MKKIVFLFFACTFWGMNAQMSEDIYVIVPQRFEFQKSANEFQLNELAKFLFEKQQFKTAYADNIPSEVAASPCHNLTADVINESGMFSSKVYVTLKDCTGKEVFKSEMGRSREKDFKKSYQEALRNAFDAGGKLAQFRKEYNPQKPVATSSSIENKTQQTVNKSVEEKNLTTKNEVSNAEILYAQPTATGFQLIDSSPKVVLKIKKTSLTNIFIAENNDNQHGILFLQGDKYVFEYEENGSLTQRSYQVKF